MQPIRYMTSLLTFYLKGEISQEQNFVNLKKPNTILGLIPLGSKNDSIPVTQLSSVQSNFKLHFGRLLVRGWLALGGLALFTLPEAVIPAILLLVIGLNGAITAFETILTIKTTSGEVKSISFLVFEKGKAQQAEKQIRQIISNRLDDTNNRVHTDRIVDAINNK